jgi:hypothetical protein
VQLGTVLARCSAAGFIFIHALLMRCGNEDGAPRAVPDTHQSAPDGPAAVARTLPASPASMPWEAGIDAAMATGYDPLLDSELELARTLAASVTQRIAFGERAGQKVRRIGSGFGYEGESPVLTGPRCASLGGFSLHANTQVPAHRRDQLERLLRFAASPPRTLRWVFGATQPTAWGNYPDAAPTGCGWA